MDKSRLVDGVPTSLFELGFTDLGVDEGWEGCGQGYNHTQHDINGFPIVDLTKFPNMSSTVAYGTARGLTMGFYYNGCACGEPIEKLINYEGDVKELVALNFSSVKLDSCGSQRNLTLYHSL